ncbi:MAG: hypothetical protein L6435_01270 [Anaerolineae bacterium]|nr:hypothetical protein [Anaerolineae bacterium]
MKLKQLFVVHSFVALFHGGGFVLAPELFMSLYGISLADPAAVFVARLFGAALLIYCFVAWFARDAEDSAARRAIVLGFFLSGIIGFIVALQGQLTGVTNSLGWLVVGLYLVLIGVGYGYFHFVKPDTT